MAKGATIYKAELNVADIDRDYYAEHALTIACHPSETEERMMVRVLAFALFASDSMEFGRGVSTQDEPTLWEKDLTGAVQVWIEIGHPEEKELRRAAGKADRVVLFCYGGRTSLWWNKNQKELGRIGNLTVIQLPLDEVRMLAGMAARSMELQCNVQDEIVSIIAGDSMVELELDILLGRRLKD